VLRRGGDGIAGPARVLPPAAFVDPPAYALVAGDGDADQRAEVFFLRAGSLTVHAGLPGVRFAAPVVVDLGEGAHDLVTRALDADPEIELAILTDSAVRIFDHQPSGWQQASQVALPPHDERRLTAGDVDGDGDDDLLVYHTDGAAAVMLVVRGGGDAATVQASEVPSSSGFVLTATLGDVNADGLDDVVFLTPSGISVRHALGDGMFAPELAVTPAVAGFRLADLDSDQRADLVITDLNGQLVTVLLAATAFGEVPQQDLGGPIQAIADVDGDGRLDILASVGANGATVWLGLGDATFHGPLPLYDLDYRWAVDVSGEGRADLFAENADSDEIYMRVARRSARSDQER
jgi:hypothetical protein